MLVATTPRPAHFMRIMLHITIEITTLFQQTVQCLVDQIVVHLIVKLLLRQRAEALLTKCVQNTCFTTQ